MIFSVLWRIVTNVKLHNCHLLWQREDGKQQKLFQKHWTTYELLEYVYLNTICKMSLIYIILIVNIGICNNPYIRSGRKCCIKASLSLDLFNDNAQKIQNWLDSVPGHIKIRISPDPECWAWSCLIIIIKSYNNMAACAWKGSDKSLIAHTIQALSDCIREHFLIIRSAFWYIHTPYLLLPDNYHTCISL